MQRLIAEQLGLPASVMKVLDQQDEEDDLNGTDLGSRAEIPQVVRDTYQRLQNSRFLMLFHNGSNDMIDLANFGFPLQDLGFPLYSSNRVLWTFQGSFRLRPRMKIHTALMKSTAGMTTGVFLSASHHERDPQELWSYLVLKEAEEVARKNNNTADCINDPGKVAECFLYMLKQCFLSQQFIDYDLTTHSGNYWICDNIIRQLQQGETDDEDGSWRAAAALQSQMQLDVDYYQHHHQYVNLQRCAESMPYWSSPPYLLIPVGAADLLNGDVFKHFSKLGVLKLSRCNFSFSSPPFIYCENLRFLWLDHCQDQVIGRDGAAEKEQVIQRCFQRLWVLDVRCMHCDRILSAQMLDSMTELRELNVTEAQDWDIGQLQGRLPNIRKLRVTKSTVNFSSCLENNLVLGMNKMELLDISGNRTMMPGLAANLCQISTSSKELVTVTVIDGCAGIQKVSFNGCAKLKNILLAGLFEHLGILDLSGIAVKVLDLRAMIVPNLDELFLDDCENLCAILWPPEDKRKTYLLKLHIDMTQPPDMDEKSMEGGSTTANVKRTSSASLSVAHGGLVPSEYYWCISVSDARLLRSLVPLLVRYFNYNDDNSNRRGYLNVRTAHVEIFSPTVAFGFAGKGDDKAAVNSRSSIKQAKDNLPYTDVAISFKHHMLLQPSQGDGDVPMLTGIYRRPYMPYYYAKDMYLHVQDRGQPRRNESQQKGEESAPSIISIPDIISDNARALHVHDSLAITTIPGPANAVGSRWHRITSCLVERCPKLECVFTTPQLKHGYSGKWDVAIFNSLNTFWGSQLPKTRSIWGWSISWAGQINAYSFKWFKSLHLDLCPRLIHVLPLYKKRVNSLSLDTLETIEIVWCGDLQAVFPLYYDDTESHHYQLTMLKFLSVKHIHLHELPKLQGICGRWRISAPMLQNIKIRGCWSLKRLPAVSSDRSNRKVECDCEKDWWEKLEWDGLNTNHHPSLYKPTHSRYYKKSLLRGSVLI
ncbi:unnamed protein product [Urochloa decumbens]|uniref:Disease resistance protein At4g27190-like leucine-rich repeats domain-containing protein n=1 Tax=Urochloa decumbens TaxID=240449 RepID=A0ABC9D8Q6_9POAL